MISFRLLLYLLFSVLCTLVQSSCVRFNLTEQLAPPDMQVPVVCRPENTEAAWSLWLHEENYYARIPICYASREYRVLGARTPYQYEYDKSAQWEFFCPLTDTEAEFAMELEYGTLKQPRKSAELQVFPVSDAKLSEWKNTGIMCSFRYLIPESVRHVPLPVREGTNSVFRMILLPPAWVVETVGNTAISLLELPGYVILWLLLPEPVFNNLP
ncbi:MAG: hypothetical protein IKW48_00645 [Akkermansia sp.]|nr:hypothetical protein [Akkermansia sp.]